MRKFKIALDMDGVITETVNPWLEKYNKDWNDNLTKRDLKHWEMHLNVKKACGRDVNNYLYEPGFFLDLEPVKGAVDGIFQLFENGHDCIILTHAIEDSEYCYSEKIKWVQKHMPWFDLKNFMTGGRKELVAGCDILLDDGPHNLKIFPNIAVQMERPWNGHKPYDYDWSVSSWKSFVGLVEELSNNEHMYNMTVKTKTFRLK